MSNTRIPFWVRIASLTAAIALTALVMPGITLEGGIIQLIGLAVVLALFNMIVRPFIIFLSIPAVLITLGLFLIVINMLMLSWSASITGWLSIDGWGWCLAGSIVISAVSAFLQGRFNREPKQEIQRFTF